MEMVPDPFVEDHETICDSGCVAVRFEPGEEVVVKLLHVFCTFTI